MLHQTVCCFVLPNPSRLCIMGSQWSFCRRRLTPTPPPDIQTSRQTDKPTPVLFSIAAARPYPQHLYPSGNTHFSIGAALKLELSFDLEAGQNANEM